MAWCWSESKKMVQIGFGIARFLLSFTRRLLKCLQKLQEMEETLNCKLYWYLKFLNHDITFVGPKTLDTFIDHIVQKWVLLSLLCVTLYPLSPLHFKAFYIFKSNFKLYKKNFFLVYHYCLTNKISISKLYLEFCLLSAVSGCGGKVVNLGVAATLLQHVLELRPALQVVSTELLVRLSLANIALDVIVDLKLKLSL